MKISRKGHSTDLALLNVIYTISRALDDKMYIVGVYIDITRPLTQYHMTFCYRSSATVVYMVQHLTGIKVT